MEYVYPSESNVEAERKPSPFCGRDQSSFMMTPSWLLVLKERAGPTKYILNPSRKYIRQKHSTSQKAAKETVSPLQENAFPGDLVCMV